MAVLLTIITYFSSPILTTIFGDGSLEVYGHSPRTPEKIVFKLVLNQGEDTEDWAHSEEQAEFEVKSPTLNMGGPKFKAICRFVWKRKH